MFSSLCTAYIVWWSSGPVLRDDIGENGIFLSFFNAAPFPFVGQFLANFDGFESLIDPTVGIAFTVVVFEHTFDTRFRIVDLLQVFTSQLSQPELLFRHRNKSLNGSAFGEGMDRMSRESCSTSATSVL